MAEIKIALIAPGWERGGGVPTVAEFLRRVILSTGRFEVSLISLSTSWRDPESTRASRPWEWLRKPAIKAVGVGETLEALSVGSRFAEWELQRYKPREPLNRLLADCDLVQVVTGSAVWANVCRPSGKPVIIQVATTLEAERRGKGVRPGIAGIVQRWATIRASQLEQQALRTAAEVFVENQWMYHHVTQLRGGGGVVFAPPGVDTDFFKPDEAAERSHVLFVGRVDDPRKNIELLLRAFAGWRARHPDSPVRLVLAGYSGPSPRQRHVIESLGLSRMVDIVLRPDAENLRRLYRTARLLALPSNEEGLGMVLLEALACGTPVISTDCGGPATIVRPGVNGLLVGVGEVEAFTSALDGMLTDRDHALEMGRFGRAIVVEQFSIAAAGRRFVESYDRWSGSGAGSSRGRA